MFGQQFFYDLYAYTLGSKQPLWINNGSNLTSFTILGAFGATYKRFNCTEKGCWRPGHIKVAGTTFRTCHKHLTKEVHDRLYQEHAAKHPDRHEVLN